MAGVNNVFYAKTLVITVEERKFNAITISI